MSEIIINIQGYGKYTIDLSLHDPATDEDPADVWRANLCDIQTGDCDYVFFEMEGDYEIWDIIDEGIQTYRKEILD